MRYKNNCRTGDRISVLGFGTSYIAEASEGEAVVKHIGLSSHTPSTIHRVLNETAVDMLMFP